MSIQFMSLLEPFLAPWQMVSNFLVALTVRASDAGAGAVAFALSVATDAQ
jgi:hypothetical protein